jgi:hypothetical protein
LLFGFALMWNGWRRWTAKILKSDSESVAKTSMPKWPLRPSNLLMLLSAGSFVYWGMQGKAAVSGYIVALSWISIGVAFIFRHMENESLKQ